MNSEQKGLSLWGASGRMGQEVLKALKNSGQFNLVQAVVSSSSPHLGKMLDAGVQYSVPGAIHSQAAMVVDFSSAHSLMDLLKLAVAAKCPVVSGSTGLTEVHFKAIEEASQHIPVFWAANFSIGLSALLAALQRLVPALPDFDIEIVETHHSAKKDAPSGTALKIADTIEASRRGLTRVHGRQGLMLRSQNELGIHALRGGSNPGRHEVHLMGRSEDLCLTHQVYSREVFALGAIKAAHFLLTAPPGLYSMSELF